LLGGHWLICQESVEDPDARAPQGVARQQIESAALPFYPTTRERPGQFPIDL
jgi:hypothetical protein